MATDIAPPTLDDGAAPPTLAFVSLAARLRAFWAATTTAGAHADPVAGRLHELLRAPAQRLRQPLLRGGHPQHAGKLAQLLLRLLRSRLALSPSISRRSASGFRRPAPSCSATAASASCCPRRWRASLSVAVLYLICAARLWRGSPVCWPRSFWPSPRSASSRTATTRSTACSC